jgi:hypothetical protein
MDIMKMPLPVLKRAGLLVPLFAMILAISGCDKCNLPKPPQASARVVVTHITAPPGGPSRRFLEVRATNFHPHAKVRITIQSYPTLNGGTEKIEGTATTDDQGQLIWIKEPVILLFGAGIDPNVDIAIALTEDNGCFTAIQIKQSEFMKI